MRVLKYACVVAAAGDGYSPGASRLGRTVLIGDELEEARRVDRGGHWTLLGDEVAHRSPFRLDAPQGGKPCHRPAVLGDDDRLFVLNPELVVAGDGIVRDLLVLEAVTVWLITERRGGRRSSGASPAGVRGRWGRNCAG